MATVPKRHYTPEEYLALERAAAYKSEYINGEIYAMTGGSEPHSTIIWNIGRELGIQIQGRPCRGYTNDMRVRVTATELYTYPDVVIVCGEVQLADAHNDMLVNPTVIFEVLSPSTEAYDRGAKFAHYDHLESLAEYVLVAQDRVSVDHFVRQGDHWLLFRISDPNASIHLASIDCTLALAKVYLNVEFPDPPTAAPHG